MNVLNRDDFLLKVEINETSCLYFCSHFYKAFKNKTRINDATILKIIRQEKLCVIVQAVGKKIKKYLRNYDT